MLELPGVTLVCIDCVRHELALAALEQSLLRCRFGAALFVTDREIPIEELRVVKVPPILTRADHARFVASNLAALVKTTHVLLIAWDAFVVNAAAWSDDFLAFDHVAPLPAEVVADAGGDGSGDADALTGGIALLSVRLLRALQDPRAAAMAGTAPAPGRALRPLLEGECGLRYAPPALADRFAFGAGYPAGQPFGFQGLFNMWMFFQARDLDSFLAMATPAILASSAALSLAVNLRELGRGDEAKAALRAILGAHPGHTQARAMLDAMQRAVLAGAAAAPTPRAVGRNDPCPCGSGQKFKQCHGRLGGPPLPAVPPSPGARESAAIPETAAGPATTLEATAARGTPAVLLHRARAAFDRNDLSEAEAIYRKVLARRPDDPVATGYLGVIATKQRRFDEAAPLLRRAITLAPDAPEYHNNLGLLHQVRAEFAMAADAYRRALALAPDYAPAHNNLGLALQEQGMLPAAIAAFRAAIRQVPAFAEAHWNLALALLLGGDFDEGLVEQEWRLQVAHHRDWWARRRQFPQWRGEPLAGRRFLILAEQGMGDMIQFVRYAEELSARGATVLVASPPDLADLLRSAPGVSAVVPTEGPYPPCDFQAPVMSLPLLCGTRRSTIPGRERYLAADPVRMAHWRVLLGGKTRPRVGVAWAGNPEQARDRYRSMPLAALEPLLAINDIEWIGLQKGAATQQIAALPPHCALRDMTAQSKNFADLAALISELDLVITIDTSVVHVAGALGKPTLLLLDTGHDWRWQQNRNDTPWYPTVRLLRQATRGDWASAVLLAHDELLRHFDLGHRPAGTTAPQS
ncbi:MAG: tetratricopeptide repeat protein [Betaproteobacteria bacterium]|nr:tetratricopeptide repeat protein [Betaproteobacteria bacterium]